ncbi:hypothetical protein ADL25_04425 [Streptomyces sp. NRRL F-5122]|nr:hypothetical protein ADL25_04425 [Streptomyces sp. NRRL F-5122]
MTAMSEADAHEEAHDGVRGLVERMSEHHRDAVRRREDEELAHAVDDAAFDLGTDIAHPTVGHAAVGFDADTDLALDNEPPELRGPATG